MTGFRNYGGNVGALTIPGQSYVAGSVNTRRNVLCLGCDGDVGSLNQPTNGDACQRYGFTIPSTAGAPVQRFRFRLRNANNAASTTVSGTVNLGAIAIGTPNSSAEQAWLGDFTGVPTTVVAAPGLTELGTTEYVSPWIYPTTFALTPGKFYGLTYGFTLTGTAATANAGYQPGWSWSGTGSAAAALLAAAPGTTPTPYQNWLDLRMEYEFAGTYEIGLVVGASFDNGTLNTITTPQQAVGHMGPDSAWHSQAALRLGHHSMNSAIGGTGCAVNNKPWVTSTALAYKRLLSPESGYTQFASVPDYAIISLVGNDAAGLASQAAWLAGIESILSILAGYGITRVYMTTNSAPYTLNFLNVSTSFMSGKLNTALGTGALSTVSLTAPQYATTPVPGPFGYGGGPPGSIQNWYTATGGPYALYIGTPVQGMGPYGVGAFIPSQGPFTVTASATGTGVLNLTVTGSLTTAAPAGTPVLTQAEWLRQQFNNVTRSLLPGIQSVIDFAADIDSQFYFPHTLPRPEFYNNSGDAHPTNNGMYTLMASRFVNGIVGN